MLRFLNLGFVVIGGTCIKLLVTVGETLYISETKTNIRNHLKQNNE